MSFKFINFIFLTFFICNISTASIPVFEKESKTKTTSKLTAFESKEIASEIEMFFKISSDNKCSDTLEYLYLRSIENLRIENLLYSSTYYKADKKLSEKTKIKNGKNQQLLIQNILLLRKIPVYLVIQVVNILY